MDCPKCGNKASCKDGVVKGRQRYLCKGCRHHYTVEKRSGTGDKVIKRQALELYLEGLGFRAIGRILKFSNVTILNWIREFGENIEDIKSDTEIKVVEIDEMHSYVQNKKTIAGFGLLLIEIGGNSLIVLPAKGIQIRAESFGKG